MNESATNSTLAPSVERVNGHDSTTNLGASLSSAPRLKSAVVDMLPATARPLAPSSSSGNDAMPSKTCGRCLGAAKVLLNAGTELVANCPACAAK